MQRLDALGVALGVLLERVPPAERTAFLLHDVFAVPFAEVAALTGRSDPAARQLASRARRRLAPPAEPREGALAEHRRLAEAFLRAAQAGDTEGLLRILRADAVLLADPAAAAMGSGQEVRGAEAVAAFFSGRAAGGHLAWADGEPALLVILGGRLRLVARLRFAEGRLAEVCGVADAGAIARMKLRPLDGASVTNGPSRAS